MRFLKLALLALPLFLLPARAEAVLVNFDDPIPPGVLVEYFNGGLSANQAVLPSSNGVPLEFVGSAIDFSENAVLLSDATNGFGPFGVLVTFDSPQSIVSGILGDFGGDPVLDNEVAHLSVFDSSGVLVGTASFSSPFAQPNLKPVSVNTGLNNITYAAFSYTNDLGFYTMDNIEFRAEGAGPGDPVIPEPASMLLFGFSAAGAAAGRFFKKRK